MNNPHLPSAALAPVLLLGACAALPDVGTSEAGQAEEPAASADEIAAELSNPTAAVGGMNNNFDYVSFDGDLPDAGDQTGINYTFQPTLPFPQDNGYNLLFRPAIPVVVDRPVFSAEEGGFEDETWELGDVTFDLAYGTTTESGLLLLGGLVGTLPTATEDAVGGDQWRFGPEALVGLKRTWGLVGLLANHQWDVAGEDDYETSVTGGQYFYAFGLGGGWQFASGPTWSYDHEAPSDDAWTLPLGLGVARTYVLGGRPWKFSLQYWDYLESPETFGPDWQVRLTVTPVVKLPWSD